MLVLVVVVVLVGGEVVNFSQTDATLASPSRSPTECLGTTSGQNVGDLCALAISHVHLDPLTASLAGGDVRRDPRHVEHLLHQSHDLAL